MGISLDIIINGKPAKKYSEPDSNQIFVEGRKGSEYKVRVSNNSSKKKKVVVSVDGLNVLTGDEVWEKGYVVDAWSNIEIPGWRIDSTKVSSFEFSSLGGSYANPKKGNVGVIGAIAFDEVQKDYPKVVHHYHYEWPKCNWPNRYTWNDQITLSGSAGGSGIGGSGVGGSGILATNGSLNSFTSTSTSTSVNNLSSNIKSTANIKSRSRSKSGTTNKTSESLSIQNSIGTGWGEEQNFNTRIVYDNFEDKASETVVIYYDSAKGLEKRGIKLSAPIKPNAFPGFEDFGCKPPR